MINSRSTLTTIIGFLCGFIIYPSFVFLLLCGGVGYFLGQLLDKVDVKNQLDTLNNIHATQDIFHPEDIPEAIIVYSRKENFTTVLLDFRVNTKPQDFRLSVLKNFLEFEFRVMEDASKTIFNLILEYPDCNYPKILTMNKQKKEMHFDIRERSNDFQTALKKIVPGLGLIASPYPDLYGEINISEMINPFSIDSQDLPPSPFKKLEFDSSSTFSGMNMNDDTNPSNHTSNNFNRDNVYKELIEYPHSSEVNDEGDVASEHNQVNHDTIIGDLIPERRSDKSSLEIKLPNLSPDDVKELKDLNARVLNSFLEDERSTNTYVELKKANQLENEHRKHFTDLQKNSGDTEGTNGIKIDYSNIQNPEEAIDEFSVRFVEAIDDRIKTMKKKKIDPEIREEANSIRDAFIDNSTSEDSVS